jgi:large subunit ribosomal protein L21
MYSIVKQGGKQYICTVDQKIRVEHVDLPVGSDFIFSEVLLVNGKKAESNLVRGTIVSHYKTDKVIVFKKKRRHNYRRKNGHRQNITEIKVTEIKE